MSERDQRPRSCHQKGEIITTVIVWLLMGAIVNVAVAWGCVATGWELRGSVESIDAPGHAFVQSIQGVLIDDVDVVDINLVEVVRAEGFELRRYLYAEPQMSGVGFPVIDQIRCGWPRGALECEWGGIVESRVRGGFRLLPSDGTLSFVVPCRPIWPGFAINTIFYAAILWLLFAAPGFVRRRFRIKRGLCPACAYPIGDSATCTECGRLVKLP